MTTTLRPSGPSSDPQALVLIAEDDPDIADILEAYLRRAGLRTVHARDGRRALEMHRSMKPDIVLLDVMMPKLDGWKVLSELRHRGATPVIMLTAMDQDIDKLMGLRCGADDYVVKPFNAAEVVARTQAVLRRTRADDERRVRVLRVDPFVIDLDQYEVSVRVEGRSYSLALTLTEFKLLTHLARSPRKVCTRAELLAACLPEGDTLERTVDSHISKLRKKLDELGVSGVPVSLRGVGYRLWGSE